jgi:PAS domain S-box-containing protein
MRPQRSLVTCWRWTIAVNLLALVLAQVALRLGVGPSLPFLGAVTVAAWYGGVWTGVLSTFLGAVAFIYLESGDFTNSDALLPTVARLGSFVGIALLITVLSASSRLASRWTRKANTDSDVAGHAGVPALGQTQADRLGRSDGHEQDGVSLTERRQPPDASRQRLQIVAVVDRLLSHRLSDHSSLQGVAEIVVKEFSTWCAIDQRSERPTLERVACAHAVSAVRHAGEAGQGTVHAANAALPGQSEVQAMISSGATPQLQALSIDPSQHPELSRLGLSTVFIVPLVSDGGLLGAMSFGWEVGTSDSDDFIVAEMLANRAALVLHCARLEREREEGQAWASSLLRGQQDALLLIDSDGKYLDANPAATVLLGYTRDELTRMRVGDLPALGSAWTEADRARFIQEGWWRGEMAVRRRDGVLVPVEVRASAVVIRTKIMYLAVLRDVSRRLFLERLKHDLAVTVGQELRQPLGKLLGLAEHLHRRTYANRSIGDVVISSATHGDTELGSAHAGQHVATAADSRDREVGRTETLKIPTQD